VVGAAQFADAAGFALAATPVASILGLLSDHHRWRWVERGTELAFAARDRRGIGVSDRGTPASPRLHWARSGGGVLGWALGTVPAAAADPSAQSFARPSAAAPADWLLPVDPAALSVLIAFLGTPRTAAQWSLAPRSPLVVPAWLSPGWPYGDALAARPRWAAARLGACSPCLAVRDRRLGCLGVACTSPAT
jgi:hypothetical protein